MKIRFFDHNATTPLWPEARAAWLEASDTQWFNPSSPYRPAAAVKVRLDAARETMAMAFSIDPEQILFNSGATEGNNSVFAHWAKCLPADAQIALSPVEHPSVIEAAKAYFAGRIQWLSVDTDGRLDLDALNQVLAVGNLSAVSVMAANNETGVCYPWAELATLCRAAGVLYHCDASQWIGKLPLGGLSNCDYVTGCAHKFGGPKGVGFLLRSNRDREFRSLRGGAQEHGLRAGTEDVAGIVSMQRALEEATVKSEAVDPNLRDAFIEQLKQRLPAVEIIGQDCARLWNTVSVIMPEYPSERWIPILARKGFLVSAGSACSTGKRGPSHVLAAMGQDSLAMRRVLRISSGWETSAEDWCDLVEALTQTYQSLKEQASQSKSKVIDL